MFLGLCYKHLVYFWAHMFWAKSNALLMLFFLLHCVNDAFICNVLEQYFLYIKCSCYHIFDDI